MNISLKGKVRLKKVLPTRLSTPIPWNSIILLSFCLKKMK